MGSLWYQMCIRDRAYCVSYDTIINSLPEFKKLAEEFGL